MKRSLKVATELAAASDRIVSVKICRGEVRVKVPDRRDMIDLAWSVDRSRIIGGRRVVGVLHEVRVVILCATAPRRWPPECPVGRHPWWLAPVAPDQPPG